MRSAETAGSNEVALRTEKNKAFEIGNSSMEDIETILALFDAARRLQTEKKTVVWPRFERSLVEKEIEEKRQWKLMVDGQIACNWTVTLSDKEIWEQRDNNDAIYIHRIAVNPRFRGNRFIDRIVEWARQYASSNGKRYVRLDTLGKNTRLIEHYTSAGFNFLGIFKLTNTQNLPAHYHREPDCCLFEIVIDK